MTRPPPAPPLSPTLNEGRDGFLFGEHGTVHPAMVEAVVGANTGYAVNFENEAWIERAVARLNDLFACDLDAFTVATGTAANAIALAPMTPPWGSILCHHDAHIETDECGAPEMFTAGARQIPLAGEHGKLDRAALETHLAEAPFGVVHALQPMEVR